MVTTRAEKNREYMRRRRAEDSSYGRQWDAANQDRVRETTKQWAAANPERVASHNLTYRTRYPEKVKAMRALLKKIREQGYSAPRLTER